MEISPQWYPAILQRRSRRQFDSTTPVPPAAMIQIGKTCTGFRPFPEARTALVNDPSDQVFKGIMGPYGKVKGSRVFIAFIGDTRNPNLQEKVGYTAEGVILEATTLGLSTCWVAGFFRSEVAAKMAEISSNERVLAVSPVGYAVKDTTAEEKLMTGFGRTHRRKSLDSMVSGMEKSLWPEWVGVALEAARLAPSAINRQPWHFLVEPGSITISTRDSIPDFTVSKRLDCGIAMLHIEVAALSRGKKGVWQLLTAPQVARFKVISQ
jgi:nitroreductase